MRGLQWSLPICLVLSGCQWAAPLRAHPGPQVGAAVSRETGAAAPRPEVRTAPYHVCIDPGHPSENNDGRTLSHGLREVTVVWEVALLLRQQLEQAGVKVTLTKQQETQFVTNRDRAFIANAVAADVLLRLHADAGSGSGFTVYYPRRTGVAQGTRGPAASVLLASARAARVFYPAFSGALGGQLRNNGLRGDDQTLIGKRQGALTGSIFSQVPTLLVEMAFLTNARDATWIREPHNKQRMAAALAKGILALRDQKPLPRGNGSSR
jgi:N-acetylmuramoyl-L-alanine amidase